MGSRGACRWSRYYSPFPVKSSFIPMKSALLTFFIGCIFFTIISAKDRKMQSCHSESNGQWNRCLIDVLPDTLHDTVKEKSLITFISGHSAFVWSLIIIDDDNIKFFSGRINSVGESHIYESNGSNLVDTVAFISANRDFLIWCVDSLPIECDSMMPVKCQEYNPIYTSLSIISKKSELIFDADNTFEFSGSDSIAFNNKFKRLLSIMRWLADPSIRPYMPQAILLNQ